jgi:hypothetical protein
VAGDRTPKRHVQAAQPVEECSTRLVSHASCPLVPVQARGSVSGNPITIYVTVQKEGKSDDESSHRTRDTSQPRKGIKPLTIDISFIEYTSLVSGRMVTVRSNKAGQKSSYLACKFR